MVNQEELDLLPFLETNGPSCSEQFTGGCEGISLSDSESNVPSCSERVVADFTRDCKKLGLEKVPKTVAGPMVRYSKLPFRRLVRLYSVDDVFSPMIYAKNFIASEKCRTSEFTTCDDDYSTVVQFASDDPIEFFKATMFVKRYSSGVNLNCGCPKRDVTKQGYGSKLLSNPELIANIVSHTRHRIDNPDYSVSVKIRINNDLKKTVELCRCIEKAGATFVVVHGRTPEQRNEPANYDAIKLVKSTLSIPVYANGGIKSYEKALEVAKYTNVDGLMAANGLLENPAMFSGHELTPVQCVKDWVKVTVEDGSSFELFHQMLMFMLRKTLSSSHKEYFNKLTNRAAVVEYLHRHLY